MSIKIGKMITIYEDGEPDYYLWMIDEIAKISANKNLITIKCRVDIKLLKRATNLKFSLDDERKSLDVLRVIGPMVEKAENQKRQESQKAGKPIDHICEYGLTHEQRLDKKTQKRNLQFCSAMEDLFANVEDVLGVIRPLTPGWFTEAGCQ